MNQLTDINDTILITEDNDDHFLLTQEAFYESKLKYQLERVHDGSELIQHLRKTKKNPQRYNLPSLIILDLNMPRKDGRETLKEIHRSKDFKNIPIIILTNSNHEMDVYISKKYGAKAFYEKPMYFDQLVELLKKIPQYIEQIH